MAFFIVMKKSFLLYCDLKHTIDKLPDETAGKLLKLILDYANGEFKEPNDLLLQVVFEPIKQSLIRDLEKYDAKVIRNRENGSKGGRPSKEDNPKKPTGLIDNPLKAKKADSDSDSEYQGRTFRCLQLRHPCHIPLRGRQATVFRAHRHYHPFPLAFRRSVRRAQGGPHTRVVDVPHGTG